MATTEMDILVKARDEASATMRRIGASTGSTTSRFSRLGSTLGSIARKGFLAVGAGATAAAYGIKKTIDAASDLNESVSKVGVVFGKSKGEIMTWSKTSATAMGISQQAALEAAGTFGNLFTAMKIGTGPATSMSKSLVQLASDLASFNNQDPKEVLENLRSGLVGEAEPLRKYGINITAAATAQEAVNLGIAKQGDVLTAAQKAQANYSLIMGQSTTAQGDFARTSTGVANRQRIVAAQFENLKATLGNAFLPIWQKVLGGVQAGIAWFTKMWPTIVRTGKAVKEALVNAFHSAVATIKTVVAAVIDFWNRMKPLRDAIAQVAGLVWNVLKRAFQALVDVWNSSLKPALADLWTALKNLWDPVLKAVAIVVGVVVGAFLILAAKALPLVIKAVGFVIRVLAGIIKGVANVIQAIGRFVGSMVRAGGTVGRAVGHIIQWFKELPGKVAGFVSSLPGKVADLFGRMRDKALEIAAHVLDWFKELPGKIAGFLSSLPEKIGNAFRAAFNAIVSLWNRLDFGFHFTVPNIPGVPGRGQTFGVDDIFPDIPTLARGGIATRPTLALIGEAGPEAVVPLNRGIGGPSRIAVSIDRRRWVDESDYEVAYRGF